MHCRNGETNKERENISRQWPLNIIYWICSSTVRPSMTDYRAVNAKRPVTIGQSGRCSTDVVWISRCISLACIGCLQPLHVSALSCFPPQRHIMILVISGDHHHHAQHNTFTLSDNETTALPLISSAHELAHSGDSWLHDWWAPRSRASASAWCGIPSACNESLLPSSPLPHEEASEFCDRPPVPPSVAPPWLSSRCLLRLLFDIPVVIKTKAFWDLQAARSLRVWASTAANYFN